MIQDWTIDSLIHMPQHQIKQQALDEAQLTLLQSKEGIERLFKEVDALRTQVYILTYLYILLVSSN